MLVITGRVERVTCDSLRIDQRWYRISPTLDGPRPIPGDLVSLRIVPATGEGRPIVESVALLRAVSCGVDRRRGAA